MADLGFFLCVLFHVACCVDHHARSFGLGGLDSRPAVGQSENSLIKTSMPDSFYPCVGYLTEDKQSLQDLQNLTRVPCFSQWGLAHAQESKHTFSDFQCLALLPSIRERRRVVHSNECQRCVPSLLNGFDRVVHVCVCVCVYGWVFAPLVVFGTWKKGSVIF